MKIEYENKNTISWCIDRSDHSKICFNAISMTGKLESIKISGEDFILEFEYEEALKFLEILKSLVFTETDYLLTSDIPIPEDESYISEERSPLAEIEDAKKSDIGLGTSYSYEPEFKESYAEGKEEIALKEPSETLEYERAFSQRIESVKSQFSESLIEERKEMIENLPEPSEILNVIQTTQESFDESMDKVFSTDELDSTPKAPIEEVVSKATPPSILKFSELSRTELDTASFFHETEEKSPLELLLEEDKIDSIGVSDPFEDIDETSKRTFSPEDMQTRSFISKFDKELSSNELESSTSVPDAVEEPRDKIKSDEPIATIQKQPISMTEEERKQKIEKERAERRRRLWELTRGF